jgi:hypothetical protein
MQSRRRRDLHAVCKEMSSWDALTCHRRSSAVGRMNPWHVPRGMSLQVAAAPQGGAESEARRGCTWRGAASGGLLPCRPCRQRARRVRPCAHRAAPAVSLRPHACLVRVFPGPQCRRSAVCAPAPGSLQWACGRALCARASCAFGCARRTWGPGGRPGVWGGVTGNGASGTVDSRV